MTNRHRRRQRKKCFTIINLILLLTCTLGIALIFYLHQNHSQINLSKASRIIPKISLFAQKDTTSISKSSTNKSTIKTSQQKSAKLNTPKITWSKQKEPVKIPILMYHAVHVMAPEEAANANLIVSPELFESQIKAMKDAGYYFLSPEEAYRALSNNELPAKKVVWLTFDDSMIDFYNVAFPILKKYGVKATNNVITGLTEKGSAANLTINQMKEMKNSGMSFQDHTVNHPDLKQSSPDTQTAEMKESKDYLDKKLNQKTIAIAYPAGQYSDTTLQIAASLNYKLGVTTNEGVASAADGLLSLKRIRILPTTNPKTLLATMNQP
ncbi:polysaccharide deacetylase family protein [Streptococcus castoreus]|uniref:polysaccharide deacetylase family protein n=1 Tax=Streptococcus castoreus TaxID=254786 RepID=UPI000486C0D0|nr:polysaccharide deacetylase family protein [Streptococcus castoreus]